MTDIRPRPVQIVAASEDEDDTNYDEFTLKKDALAGILSKVPEGMLVHGPVTFSHHRLLHTKSFDALRRRELTFPPFLCTFTTSVSDLAIDISLFENSASNFKREAVPTSKGV